MTENEYVVIKLPVFTNDSALAPNAFDVEEMIESEKMLEFPIGDAFALRCEEEEIRNEYILKDEKLLARVSRVYSFCTPAPIMFASLSPLYEQVNLKMNEFNYLRQNVTQVPAKERLLCALQEFFSVHPICTSGLLTLFFCGFPKTIIKINQLVLPLCRMSTLKGMLKHYFILKNEYWYANQEIADNFVIPAILERKKSREELTHKNDFVALSDNGQFVPETFEGELRNEVEMLGRHGFYCNQLECDCYQNIDDMDLFLGKLCDYARDRTTLEDLQTIAVFKPLQDVIESEDLKEELFKAKLPFEILHLEVSHGDGRPVEESKRRE